MSSDKPNNNGIRNGGLAGNNVGNICWLNSMLQLLSDTDFSDLLNTVIGNYPNTASIRDKDFILLNTVNIILNKLKSASNYIYITDTDYDNIAGNIFTKGDLKEKRDEFQDTIAVYTGIFGKLDNLLQEYKKSNEFYKNIIDNLIITFSISACIIYYASDEKTILNTPNFVQTQEITLDNNISNQKITLNELLYIKLPFDSGATEGPTVKYKFTNNQYEAYPFSKYITVSLRLIRFTKTMKNVNIINSYISTFSNIYYKIKGVICYVNGDSHYYYISYKNGLPNYLYNDSRVSEYNGTLYHINTTSVFLLYEKIIDVKENDYYKILQNIFINENIVEEQEKFINDMFEGEASNLISKIKSYISRDKAEISSERYNPILYSSSTTSFFTPITTKIVKDDASKPSTKKSIRESISTSKSNEIVTTILNCVIKKDLYNLFDISDTANEQFHKSMELNTEFFKNVYDTNKIKSSESEVKKDIDIDNVYNKREELFSTKKTSNLQKYTIFNYNTDVL